MIINKDILIVGAGPAGITAALYLARSKYSFALVEKSTPGGKLNITTKIDNYPAVSSVDGSELTAKMIDQLANMKVDIVPDNIKAIKKDNNDFIAYGESDEYHVREVILGTGVANKKANIPNEDKFLGKGISYCAVCDGFFNRNKDVMVFAKDRKGYLEALYLSNIVKHLYLVSDLDKDDDEGNLTSLKALNNVEFLSPYKILSFEGKEFLEDVIIENLNDNSKKTISINACFPFLGDIPSNSLAQSLGIVLENGFIKVDNMMKTNVDGVYAVGDVVVKPLRQIVTACNDGAIAATAIIRKLNSLK
ncbi:MAG: FAD-dependent oxidoreductase [Bacilli bacterium]